MTARTALLAMAVLIGTAWPTLAQQRDEDEAGWVGIVEGIESCLADKVSLLHDGFQCIGRFSSACLRLAQNQTTVGMERCYLDEYRAWDALLNRHYRDRPRGAAGAELQQVQRAWITYRDRKCSYFRVHFDGGSIARPLGAHCMMDTTARRAIEIRFLTRDR